MNKTTATLISLSLFWFTFSYISGQEVQERMLNSFTAIEVSQGMIVHLSEGAEHKVTVEADEEMLSSIITEVKGGTLKLSINDKYKRLKFNNLSAKINVILPKLTALHASGGSVVVGNSEFTTEDLAITVSTGADIRFNEKFVANKLNLNVSSKGKFLCKAKSTATNAYIIAASHGEALLNIDVENNIECSGAGNGKIIMIGKATDALLSGTSHSELRMKAFEVQNANVVATTSASIGITVKEFLAATATYGANINYWGKPKSLSKEALSGGKIK